MVASNSNTNSLQWMVSAGVDQAEVNWLDTVLASSLRDHPVSTQRVKEITDRAFAGLLASIVNPSINYAGKQ